MDTLVLNTRKEKLKRRKVPCQMTIDELKEEVRQAVKDLDNGLGISQEDIEKKIASW